MLIINYTVYIYIYIYICIVSDVTAVSKEATSAEPHLEKSKTVTAGDFVIRTRRQRHVEQFGEEGTDEQCVCALSLTHAHIHI